MMQAVFWGCSIKQDNVTNATGNETNHHCHRLIWREGAMALIPMQLDMEGQNSTIARKATMHRLICFSFVLKTTIKGPMYIHPIAVVVVIVVYIVAVPAVILLILIHSQLLLSDCLLLFCVGWCFWSFVAVFCCCCIISDVVVLLLQSMVNVFSNSIDETQTWWLG